MPASVKPSCANVRGHPEIDDSPPSDQPTPSSPLPARLLYDSDNWGATTPATLRHPQRHRVLRRPIVADRERPLRPAEIGALATSPPGGGSAAAAPGAPAAVTIGYDNNSTTTKPNATGRRDVCRRWTPPVPAPANLSTIQRAHADQPTAATVLPPRATGNRVSCDRRRAARATAPLTDPGEPLANHKSRGQRPPIRTARAVGAS